MSKPPNGNHELTTLQVRQDIERVVADVGAKLSPQQSSELVTRIAGKLETYSSPYPPPQFLQAMESLVPGSAKEILAEGIKNSAHYRDVEIQKLAIAATDQKIAQQIIRAESDGGRRGQWFGALLFLAVLCFASFCLWYGNEKLAYVAFGAAFIGIIGQIISAGRFRSEEEKEKDPEPLEKKNTKKK